MWGREGASGARAGWWRGRAREGGAPRRQGRSRLACGTDVRAAEERAAEEAEAGGGGGGGRRAERRGGGDRAGRPSAVFRTVLWDDGEAARRGGEIARAEGGGEEDGARREARGGRRGEKRGARGRGGEGGGVRSEREVGALRSDGWPSARDVRFSPLADACQRPPRPAGSSTFRPRTTTHASLSSLSRRATGDARDGVGLARAFPAVPHPRAARAGMRGVVAGRRRAPPRAPGVRARAAR